MVIVSSGLGLHPLPGVTLYCATKSFVSFLARGLHYEVDHKVDKLDYAAGSVSTALNPSKVGTVTVNTASKGVISAIGRDVSSYGWAYNELTTRLLLVGCSLFTLLSYFSFRVAKKVHDQKA